MEETGQYGRGWPRVECEVGLRPPNEHKMSEHRVRDVECDLGMSRSQEAQGDRKQREKQAKKWGGIDTEMENLD